MTEILVVSDSHGNFKRLASALEKQMALDEKFRPRHLVHLGDGIEDIEKCKLAERLCVHSVKGNCDSFFYSDVPTERLLELGGYKILVMHGHTRSVKLGDSLAVARAAECEADLLLYGHTHTPTSYAVEKGTVVCGVTLKKDLKVFNPGSLGYGGSFGVVSLGDGCIICSHGSIK